jgi:hypothetical protein
MTLLLTLAAPWGIYQSSDYRLTAMGGRQGCGDDIAGSKQLTLSAQGIVAKVCFTGFAEVGLEKTIQWISQILSHSPQPPDLTRLAHVIARKAAAVAHGLPIAVKPLTVIIAAVEVGVGPVLILISNIDRFDGRRREIPLDELIVSVRRPTAPILFSFGCDVALSRTDRRYLLHLLRSARDAKPIMLGLAFLNAAISKRAKSRGLISEGCAVSSILVTGNHNEMNHGQVAGIPDSFFGDFNIGAFLRKHLEAAPGKQVALVQSAGVSRKGDEKLPELKPEGEARTFKFSTPCASFSFGVGLADKLSLAGRSGSVTIRKNEVVVTEFSDVLWESKPSAVHPAPTGFFPTYQFPNVPTVDGAQPHSWSYGADITTDGEHRVLAVRPMCVAFRSVNLPRPLAILGETEELLMCAPTDGLSLLLGKGEESATGVIRVEFHLRDFPELGPPTSNTISVKLS